jgi:hypothetical protein
MRCFRPSPPATAARRLSDRIAESVSRPCYDPAVTLVDGEAERTLARVAAGDSATVDALLPQIYDEMRQIAARLFKAADCCCARGLHAHGWQPSRRLGRQDPLPRPRGARDAAGPRGSAQKTCGCDARRWLGARLARDTPSPSRMRCIPTYQHLFRLQHHPSWLSRSTASVRVDV